MKYLFILLLVVSCGKDGTSRYHNPIEKAHREVDLSNIVINPQVWEREKIKSNAKIYYDSTSAYLQDLNTTSTIELEPRFYNAYRFQIANESSIRVFGSIQYSVQVGDYVYQIDYYQTTGDIKPVSY